ncbi:MAG: CHRD domain-containing protein, partial [Ilumatobacteraceae bacterium]
MQNKKMFALTAIGLAAAIAIPTVAFGNARRNEGSLAEFKTSQTPLVGLMNGPADLTATTPTGDADGTGSAAFTFSIDAALPGGAQVCWDLSYSNLTGTPTAAHIHRGAAGVAGPVVVPAVGSFPNLGANSATGCMAIDPTLAQEILTTPASFYVNVHTTDFQMGAIRSQLSSGPAPAGEAHLLSTPLRAYDSRDNAGAKIQPSETRTISLASGKDQNAVAQVAVPAGATAAIVTLTVTETGTGIGGNGGFLKMYAGGTPTPATSSINWAG